MLFLWWTLLARHIYLSVTSLQYQFIKPLHCGSMKKIFAVARKISAVSLQIITQRNKLLNSNDSINLHCLLPVLFSSSFHHLSWTFQCGTWPEVHCSLEVRNTKVSGGRKDSSNNLLNRLDSPNVFCSTGSHSYHSNAKVLGGRTHAWQLPDQLCRQKDPNATPWEWSVMIFKTM